MWHGLDLHRKKRFFWVNRHGWIDGPWKSSDASCWAATTDAFTTVRRIFPPGPDRVGRLVDRNSGDSN